MSQQLLDASLTVQQESSALSELQQRFGSDQDIGTSGKASLHELIKNHASRLVAGLGKEESILENAQLLVEGSQHAHLDVMPATSTLTVAAAGNATLCKALILGSTAGNSPNPPTAQSIAALLIASVHHLRAIANSLYAETETESQVPRPSTHH